MEGKLGLCLLMNLLYNVYLCFDCSLILGKKSVFGVGEFFLFWNLIYTRMYQAYRIGWMELTLV